MPVFVINLDRRADRMAYISRTLADLGMAFERVSAIDGLNLPPPRDEQVLSNKERACHLSHRECWMRLLASGASAALVLEDDAVLSRRLPELVAEPALIPPDSEIVRLETDGGAHSISFRALPLKAGFKLHRLLSGSIGSAAYVIRRDVAEKLLSSDRSLDLEADIAISPRNGLRVYQVVPAPAMQGFLQFDGEPSPLMKSDIGTDRRWFRDRDREKRRRRPMTFRRLVSVVLPAPLRQAYRRVIRGTEVRLIPPDSAYLMAAEKPAAPAA
jgi:glycosyl transferase family 25